MYEFNLDPLAEYGSTYNPCPAWKAWTVGGMIMLESVALTRGGFHHERTVQDLTIQETETVQPNLWLQWLDLDSDTGSGIVGTSSSGTPV